MIENARKNFVTVHEVGAQREKLSSQIPNHQMFTGQIAGYPNQLFVKLDDAIWSLDAEVGSEPGNYWISPDCPIKNYNTVTKITVTVEK